MKSFMKLTVKDFIEKVLVEHNPPVYQHSYFGHVEKDEKHNVFMEVKISIVDNVPFLFLTIPNSAAIPFDIMVKHVFTPSKRQYKFGEKIMKPKMLMYNAVKSYLAFWKRKEMEKLNHSIEIANEVFYN